MDDQFVTAAAAFVQSNEIGLLAAFFIGFALIEIAKPARAATGSATSGRLLVNFGMIALTSLFALVLPLSYLSVAAFAEREALGLNRYTVAPILLLALAIVLRSFLAYWIHRMLHAVPFLWRFHRIHHSDPHIDVTTAFRQYPLVLLPSLLFLSIAFLIFGIPVWAVVLSELVLLVATMWQHADTRTPSVLQPHFDQIFSTPENHLVHHSRDRQFTDSNFGTLLIGWDRMFGTYRSPQSAGTVITGLDGTDPATAGNLIAQLGAPFRRGG